MIVSTLTWDKVTVRYKEPGKADRKDTYSRATVSFAADSRGLTISQPGNSDNSKSLVLARAELISLSPWGMWWRAYWWSAKPDSANFDKLIEAEVTCEF